MGNLTRTIPYRTVLVDLATPRNSWPGNDPARGAGSDALRIQVKEQQFEILYAPAPFFIHLGSPDAPGILIPEGTTGTPQVCDGEAFEAVYISNDPGGGEARILTGPVRAGFNPAGSVVPELAGAEPVGLFRLGIDGAAMELHEAVSSRLVSGASVGGGYAGTGRIPGTEPAFQGQSGVWIHIPSTDPGGTEYNWHLGADFYLPADGIFAAGGVLLPGPVRYRIEDVIGTAHFDGGAGSIHTFFGVFRSDVAGQPEGIGFHVNRLNRLIAWVKSRDDGTYSGDEVYESLLDDTGANILTTTPRRLTLDFGVDDRGPFAEWYVDGRKRHEWVGQRFVNVPTRAEWRPGYYGVGGTGGVDATAHYSYFGMAGGPRVYRFVGELEK